MSKTRETSLWNWLKKAKPIFKRGLCLDRIENSALKSMPDTNGHLKGAGEFWIELKTATRPTDPGNKVRTKFQDGQPEWHRKRAAVGCNVFVLLQVGSYSKARRYLLPGEYAHKMQSGMTESELEARSIIPPVCLPEEVVQLAADYRPI